MSFEKASFALGVVTAIGGSFLRDVLSGRKTLLMSKEINAGPVVNGCLIRLSHCILPQRRRRKPC